ncbi:MAG TPA: cytochrome o ubiquinol oxidase subunit IV [Candidatus Saccharimonadia bacterium]|nr:cytochrome o ubiquinol oxidase subunit IV [Candidatus Saccharimonadia bacterium]
MRQLGTRTKYVMGFLLSVLLTLGAYLVVVTPAAGLTRSWIVAVILLLATVQLAVQLYFFLHLGQEAKPRWNLLTFGFMALVLGILVLGSLWIMANLNYHMQSPSQLDHSIIKDEGVQP